MTRKMNEAETRALIAAGTVGRLGCVDDGEPYVVPISYLFEDEAIYSHSLPGRKIAALRNHPRACLQVDRLNSEFHWQSAIASGSFEEIHGEPGTKVLRKLLERFPMLTPVESVIVKGPPEVIVFRIRIEQVTGVAED